MRITLVRHGQTDGNRRSIHQTSDSPLNPEGLAQAAKVAERLKGERFDAMFASDWSRAAHTAEHIKKYHDGVPFVYDSRLREIHLGPTIQGKPHGTFRQLQEASSLPFLEFRPEGGESHGDVRRRVEAFYDELCETHQGKSVLIVTHGGPVMHMLLHALDAPHGRHTEFAVSNTSVTILDASGRPAKLLLLNCTKHLD